MQRNVRASLQLRHMSVTVSQITGDDNDSENQLNVMQIDTRQLIFILNTR